MMTTASKERNPGLFARLFGARADDRSALYDTIVAEGRRPEYYAIYGVPDTNDGRFDMIALVLSLVLLRLEREGADHDSVRLTERFIADMDGQIREIGFGDLVVGKQVGGIMAVLGGRLGAYRKAVDAETLSRTLWRNNPPAEPVLSDAVRRIHQLQVRIDSTPLDALLAGRIA